MSASAQPKLIALIVLIAVGAWALPVLQSPGFKRPRSAAAGGGGSGVSITEDFNCANSDDPDCDLNWTEIGDLDIVSNAGNAPQTFDNTFRGAAAAANSLGTANQAVKVTLTANNTGGNVKLGVLLRYTDASTECYYMECDIANNQVTWNRLNTPTTGASVTLLQTKNLTFSIPDSLGFTITGTGTSTIVRAWLNPSGNHQQGDGADVWNGDNTPDLEFSDDPSDAVDSGNFVGLLGRGSLGALEWDDFFGGDIP
jgi:hypothetical protein